MAWLELSFESSKDFAELIEDFLLEQGALAVTIQDRFDDAIFEPELGTTPLWPSNTITGLFDTNINGDALFLNLQGQLGANAPTSFRLQALEDRDWEREWLKHYKSMCFGERLWIVPSENLLENPKLPQEMKQGDIVLKMDPGLAFGTGTHETTALCLEWLARHDIAYKTVVDYGCGSGILAIAAHLLGAKLVLGCDLDPQAILASEENARRNNIQKGFEIYDMEGFRKRCKASAISNPFKADIVVANILAGPLEKLCSELANLLDRDGIIVLSGILNEQAKSLELVYQEFFQDIKIEAKNDWIRLVATKR